MNSRESLDPVLRVSEVSKRFPGVLALDDVSLTVRSGEVLGLVGENGAGKSTLISIMTGALTPDSGHLYLDGQPVKFPSTRQAREAGIACIYQEFNLIPRLNVYENMFLGREYRRLYGALDRTTMVEEARRWIDELDGDFDVRTSVQRLSRHQQQLVEIARALAMEARILIMDEPTAPLARAERESLYELVENLRDQNVTVVYVSHHLDEIFRLADRITVLRNGNLISTRQADQTSEREIIRMMVGEELTEMYPDKTGAREDVALEAENLSSGDEVQSISFQLRVGEILGLAGVLGSGRTELMEALFGRRPSTGNLYMDGTAVSFSSPRDAIRHGLAYLTRDRHEDGLILEHSLTWNLTLPSLGKRQFAGIIRDQLERDAVKNTIDRLNIETVGGDKLVRFLSGGNQQKTVLGKWLLTEPRILLCDEPTQGVDVGARSEIYSFLEELTRQGLSVVVISADLTELMGFSDRILAMRRGRITAQFSPEEYSEEAITAATTMDKNSSPEVPPS